MTNSKKPTGIKTANWGAVRLLLDDESEVVRDGLIKLLQNTPEEGREFLIGLSQGDDSYLAKHAQNMIEKFGDRWCR